MKKSRLFCIIALLLAALLCLTGCEGKESKYKKAQSRIADGKYDEAVKILDELGDYEDSSRLIMYAKAIQAGEAGDFRTTIASFTALEDFRDSKMMVTYYTGREYEANSEKNDKGMNLILAAKTYQTLGLFRDSKERCDDCFERAYNEAAAQAGNGDYAAAIALYNEIPEYKDSKDLAVKAGADALYDSGNWAVAHEIYMTLDEQYRTHSSDYKNEYDAAVQKRADGKYDEAVESFTKLGNYNNSTAEIPATWYAKGVALYDAGDWEGARTAFVAAGDYLDSGDRILMAYYSEGEAKREAKDWEGARTAFEKAQNYSDAEEQITITYYVEGETRRAAQEWDGARLAFSQAGSYNDAEVQIKETTYQEAEALEASGDQEGAYKLFISLADYKDSFERAGKPYYLLGLKYREEQNWSDAISSFYKALGYSDAKDQIVATYYAEGIAEREEQKWVSARTAFKNAGKYSDASEQILATYYVEGEAKRAAQDWNGAKAAFEKAGDYKDSKTQVSETLYQEASVLFADGEYEKAYDIYNSISGYKDVDSLLSTDARLSAITYERKIAPFQNIGSIVTFGRYEQDNNLGNGQESIEWIILDVQDEKVLLLSRYGLDSMPYNKDKDDITWEKCSLRSWLNSDFLNKAFSAEEQAAILMSEVENDANQGYSQWNTDGGNNTQDQIFLLSYAEANRFLGVTKYDSRNEKSRVAPTDYAISHGSKGSNMYRTIDGKGADYWWLRSPGRFQYSAACVLSNGSLHFVNVDTVCAIRPAIWLDLKSANLSLTTVQSKGNNPDEDKPAEERPSENNGNTKTKRSSDGFYYSDDGKYSIKPFDLRKSNGKYMVTVWVKREETQTIIAELDLPLDITGSNAKLNDAVAIQDFQLAKQGKYSFKVCCDYSLDSVDVTYQQGFTLTVD